MCLLKYTSAQQTRSLFQCLSSIIFIKHLTESSSTSFKHSRTVLHVFFGSVAQKIWHILFWTWSAKRIVPLEIYKCSADKILVLVSVLELYCFHQTHDRAFFYILQAFQNCLAFHIWLSSLEDMAGSVERVWQILSWKVAASIEPTLSITIEQMALAFPDDPVPFWALLEAVHARVRVDHVNYTGVNSSREIREILGYNYNWG